MARKFGRSPGRVNELHLEQVSGKSTPAEAELHSASIGDYLVLAAFVLQPQTWLVGGEDPSAPQRCRLMRRRMRSTSFCF